MCTAVTYKNRYFGRNLDLEYSYNETVTITPKNFPLNFRFAPSIDNHHAIIGMAYVSNDYPLYYDAVNEKRLGIAGLNFPSNAVYLTPHKSKTNIAPFEFVLWILCQCKSVDEAVHLISNTNLVNADFSDELPATPLHWIISDANSSITVEPLSDGIKIYDNPVGVLTNNPTFDVQMLNLSNYMGISPTQPKNNFSDALELTPYSRGMGALGLPGDLSSQSRFVRAVFTTLNSISDNSENAGVGQFFHILDAVSQTKGCNDIGNKVYEYTQYSSCCNLIDGIYYYTTYENRRITAHDMHKENLDGQTLITYPLIKEQDIKKGC